MSKETKATKYFRERNDALQKLVLANSTIQKLWGELDERQDRLSDAESRLFQLKEKIRDIAEEF
jgi:hypothetical protein